MEGIARGLKIVYQYVEHSSISDFECDVKIREEIAYKCSLAPDQKVLIRESGLVDEFLRW